MDTRNKLEVSICGENITLMSEENEEHMQKVALYINRKLGEIKKFNSNASINERTRALFIAVNIADDYFKTLDQLHIQTDIKNRQEKELERLLSENESLAKKNQNLQDQLNKVRAEREAYKEAFGPLEKDNETGSIFTITPRTVSRRRRKGGGTHESQGAVDSAT